MTDISDWYKNIPQFTRYWLSATLGISLLSRFGLLQGQWLVLVFELVYTKFHVSNMHSHHHHSFEINNFFFHLHRYGVLLQHYFSIQ